MATHPHNRTMIRMQRGAALIVSLLILLVLTLLGVTAMTTSTQQEKMATNSREYNMAFQAAESALRDGESEVQNNSPAGYSADCTGGGNGNGGLCLPSTNGVAIWSSIGWDSATSRAYGAKTGATALLDITIPPRYIIEKLPPAVLPGQGGGISQGSCYGCNPTVQNYRVTAQGSGANGTGRTMLQSVYRP